MKKYWSIFSAVGFTLVTAFTPSIQGALSHHPLVTTVVSSLVAVVAHWLPSPAGS